MSRSHKPETVYARFYDKSVLAKLYALVAQTDRPITYVVELACAFAFSHPDFKVEPRPLTLVESSLAAKARRAKKFKTLAAGL